MHCFAVRSLLQRKGNMRSFHGLSILAGLHMVSGINPLKNQCQTEGSLVAASSYR